MENINKSALEGMKVLELGQLIAAPFAGSMLAGFGAEVIKVEPPSKGDPMRTWRKMRGDTSLWWSSISRNKKSITVDLRQEEGQQIIRKLVESQVDIVVENFRPGRLEEWGLGYEDLKRLNPRLIMVRVSGWGQDGPYANRPGFASVAEGVAGLRYLTGEPGRPPVRTGISLGDTLAGLHAVIGLMNAIYERDIGASNEGGSGKGQLVDAAIYESVFNVMESLLPEYDYMGHVRERSGAKLGGIVPSNTYQCSDGKYIIIGGNNDAIFKRLMTAVGRQDLADSPSLDQNHGRVKEEEKIDSVINSFTSSHSFEEVYKKLSEADVPVGPINSIEDIVKDPQFIARNMFEKVKLGEGEEMAMPRMVPKLERTPAKTNWPGPKLGEHNQEILLERLGYSEEEIENLIAKKVL